MKHFYLSLLLAVLHAGLPVSMRAQTDVTDLLLDNWGFDTAPDYDTKATGNVAQEILPVAGWTAEHQMNYTIVGTYAYGSTVTFNTSGRIPAQGHDGSAGCLALSTGWGSKLVYTQAVTLPAGTYTIKTAWYNGSNQTAAVSLVGWVPATGQAQLSKLTLMAQNQWTTDEQTFTLTGDTQGKVQLGLQAAAGSSANSAKPVLDYIKVFADEAAANTLTLRRLTALWQQASSLYGDGTGHAADSLKRAIDHAHQLIAAAGTADRQDMLAACRDLQLAVDYYQAQNVSEAHPRDVTATYLSNPSFEAGTEAWTVNNLAVQSNGDFKHKVGTKFLEIWVNRGSKVGDASVSQLIRQLPQGKYRLTAVGHNIQQRATGSDLNISGSPQTGASLTAGYYALSINTSGSYALNFAVTDKASDISIGASTHQATGNWFVIDHFQLYYTGTLDLDALKRHLDVQIAEAEKTLAGGVQTAVRQETEQAIAQAREALTATATTETLSAAVARMDQAIAQAAASHNRYEQIDRTLDYARKVLAWWKDDVRKHEQWARLDAAVAQPIDYSWSDDKLQEAVAHLDACVKAVDKRIYESGNAVGTGDQLKNENSNWCYQRSRQSKHWILFWEKDYGPAAPAGIDDILSRADQIFEFYADSLKFIKINQGKSKADTYKMIIRLRATSEWEATGSGIDDMIGLLTLSRWAYTSRGGQTVAHEIGHCFQYQVHCDNGGWDGWMYNWEGSPNGNVWWEMCAQWQAYKFYPHMQFDNEWLDGTLNGLHKHPFCEELRYHNYFLQDYMAQLHGMDIVGRLWNESRNPEDVYQAYMRITMPDLPQRDRLAKLNDEMFDYAARMTTFDIDHLRTAGAGSIGRRAQAAMTAAGDDFWQIQASQCPENFGNNAIRLNVPTGETEVSAEFVGLPKAKGYRRFLINNAGWRVGFVALKNDGTRVYGDMGKASNGSPETTVSFTCPKDCRYLWLVVSGAPGYYWPRGWDGSVSNDEQWPYKVRFNYTNLYGRPNHIPTGIVNLSAGTHRPSAEGVYTVTGQLVRQGTTSTAGLPAGIYVVNGRKVVVR